MANNEQVTVNAEKREGRGKNDSRRLRAAGKIPVTIYGGEGEAVAASVDLKDLAAILRTDRGASTIFSIDVAGIGASEVMFADRQIDPLKGRLKHADLRRLVRGQEIEVSVPLHLDGEPTGVTEDGGILDHVIHTVQIRCRPSLIPDAIHADVANLGLNEVLHIEDIKPQEGITLLADPKQVVATVKYVSEEALEESLTSQVEPGVEPAVETKEDEEAAE
jgi:large subunit ribosomal protein L25